MKASMPHIARVVVLGAVGALASGCAFDASGVGGIDGGEPVDGDLADAPDPTLPDAGPPADGAPPDGAPCVPTCLSGTTLDDCSGGPPVTCPLGCGVGPTEDVCLEIKPSNGVGREQLVGVSNAGVVSAGVTVVLDTDTGEIRAGNTTIRAAGTGVKNGIRYEQIGPSGVFAFASLTVADGGALRGRGTRPLVLLSAGDVIVRGRIDVSAGCPPPLSSQACGGPGGGSGSTAQGFAKGCGPGGDGSGAGGNETGGGGGALGEAGASGADSGMADPGGQGGAIGMCVGPTLVPLAGGSGGGAGGGDVFGGGTVPGGDGGGGGGGVQITSYTRIVVAKLQGGGTPQILASGGGGETGPAGLGGGGGGSGGAILLEAPSVELTAAVAAANGGGGGGGNGTGSGEKGRPDDKQAQGGGGNNDGHGGDGGAKQGAPEAGFGNNAGDFDGTGGGGGGAGLIRINAGLFASGGGTIVSPAAAMGTPASQLP
jgi:hypothetical protein